MSFLGVYLFVLCVCVFTEGYIDLSMSKQSLRLSH